MTKLLVTTALGDMSYYEELKSFHRQRRYMLVYAVFSFSSEEELNRAKENIRDLVYVVLKEE